MGHMWRLSEAGPRNLGLAFSDDGLLLGHTSLVERRGGRFVVRSRNEIERLLKCAYDGPLPIDRLMSGFARVAAALNANDQCSAHIAAVHMRVPDLPSPAIRDALAREDSLIKYARDEGGGSADWNPALHPRTGTAPNPGWFAPTGGTGVSSPARFAESGHSPHRTDALAVSDDWVHLPEGNYIDELSDLIEWLVNARPEDEKAIRAEIKRLYYDVGDTVGGHELNRALSEVLQPGVTTAERQEIANGAAHYAHGDPSNIGFARDLLAGAVLFLSPWLLRRQLPDLPATPPGIEFEATAISSLSVEQREAIWKLPPWVRGKIIDKIFRQGNLHELSRTIDDFVDGTVISNKSIDLNASTYQNSRVLMSRLNKYIGKLKEYSGTEWGGDIIASSDIDEKVLRVVVPEGGMTAAQREIFEAATRIARSKGIRLIVSVF
jgi:hypothetical protein